MNSRPTILRFSSGSATPASAARNRSAASTTCSLTPVAATKSSSTCSASPGPQQPVVDEHAGELVAHRPLHQRRRDRGVDPAGQPADHPLAADLGADRRDLLLDDVRLGPQWTAAGAVVQEPLEDRLSAGGVQHLGVELHAEEPRGEASSNAATGLSGVDAVTANPGGAARHRVAVRHPHRARSGEAASTPPASDHGQRRAAELGPPGARHRPAQRLRHRLEAVADAERRHARR